MLTIVERLKIFNYVIVNNKYYIIVINKKIRH